MSRAFDGSSQYLEATGVPVSGYPFTISAWLKPTSNANGTVVGFARSANSGPFVALAYNSTGVYIEVLNSGSGDSFAGTLANGVWGHVACVCTAATSRLAYANGVAGTTDTTNLAFPTVADRLNVGALAWSSPDHTSFRDGSIGEVAIWDIALSAGQIAALAAGDSPLTIAPSDLVRYYRILGISSPEPEYFGATSLTVSGATLDASDPPVDPPSTVPDVPTNPHAHHAGPTSARVTWTAPVNDGGQAITDYVVTPYIAGVAQTPQNVGSAATVLTATGLTTGTAYTFKVAAINPIGTGSQSGDSNSITPLASATTGIGDGSYGGGSYGVRTAATVFNDSCSGTIALTGSRAESRVGADSPSASLPLSGTRTEAAIHAGSPSASIGLSGSVVESHEFIYGDAPSGSLALAGAATEGLAQEAAPSGTIAISSSLDEEFIQQFDDSPTGTIALTGSAEESYTSGGPDNTTLIDNFNRGDGPATSGAWDTMGVEDSGGDLVVSSNKLALGTANGSGVTSFEISGDQDQIWTISTIATSYYAFWLGLADVGGAGFDGYGFIVIRNGIIDSWELRHYADGSPTTLASANHDALAPSDRVWIEVDGTTITAHSSSDGTNWDDILTYDGVSVAGRWGYSGGDTTQRLDDLRGGGQPTIYDDAPSGDLVLAGSATGVASYADSPTGTMQLTGSVAETAARSSAPNGTLAVSGSAATSFTHSNAPTGSLALSGAASAARSHSNAPSGSMPLSGSATDAYGHIHNDTPTGTLSLTGTCSDAKATSRSVAGSIGVSGTRTQSHGHSDSRSGSIGLTGSCTTTLTYSDLPAGLVTLIGERAEVGTYVDTPVGTISFTGIVIESWDVEGAVFYNDHPAGTIRLAGRLISIGYSITQGRLSVGSNGHVEVARCGQPSRPATGLRRRATTGRVTV